MLTLRIYDALVCREEETEDDDQYAVCISAVYRGARTLVTIYYVKLLIRGSFKI